MEATNDETAVFEKPKARINCLRGRQKALLWCGVVVVITMFFVVAIILICNSTLFMIDRHGEPPVSMRGRNIYVAITSANVDREALGLGNLWPKTQLPNGIDDSTNDIGTKIFTNSSDYFYELYDGANVGTDQHDPYLKGFDYSKLAASGVPAKVGGGGLTAENNMWAIAANITEDDADIIPVLITRNVDVKLLEYVINHGGATSNSEMRVAIGAGEYKTPFGDMGFVCVRKGGGTFNVQAKYATVRYVFNSQTLPPRDPSKPPIVYLMP
jgi:hypothetical protein